MALSIETLVAFLVIISAINVVHTLPVAQDLKHSISNSAILSLDDYSDLNLLRIKKEAARLGVCSKGKFWYLGKCKTLEELKRLEEDQDSDDEPTIAADVSTQTEPVQVDKIPKTNAVTEATTAKSRDEQITENSAVEKTVDVDQSSRVPDLTEKLGKFMKMQRVVYYSISVVICALALLWLFKLLHGCYLKGNGYQFYTEHT